MTMIQITQLKKQYGPIQALKGVTLTIQPARITGLVGPNACGKTTLIKSLLGLVIPDSGELTLEGQPVLGRYDYRNNIGYLPQNPDYPENLKIRELFDMIEDLRCCKALYKEELITLFDLASSLNRSFSTLSGGTKQKVGVVIAFMFNPQILILDEPTVGLDPLSVVRLKKLMRERAGAGACVLLVSHIMSELEELVSDVIFLLEGQVVTSGSLNSILSQTNSQRLEEAVMNLLDKSYLKGPPPASFAQRCP